jgi:hypothetical protein
MRQAFCGFHYQPATINKFFRELKYYDLEHVLNQMQGQFWFNVWNSESGKTVILFVDKEIQLTAKREKEKTKFSKEASDLNKKKKALNTKAEKKDKEIEKLSGK